MAECFNCEICRDCGLMESPPRESRAGDTAGRLTMAAPVAPPVKHRIHLHGRLGKRYGQTFEMAVNTPAQAVRLLAYQIKGFADDFAAGAYRLVRGDKRRGLFYDEKTLLFPIGGKPQDFHIIPVAAGAKRGGLGKVVLGAVILTTGLVGAGYAASANGTGFIAGLGELAIGSVTWGGISMFGAAMVLNGVSQMLQPSVAANYSQTERPDQRASFFLGGQVNQAEQGAVIPVVYGRVRVGSIVASAGLTVEKL